jgi:hypothetical protein
VIDLLVAGGAVFLTVLAVVKLRAVLDGMFSEVTGR